MCTMTRLGVSFGMDGLTRECPHLTSIMMNGPQSLHLFTMGKPKERRCIPLLPADLLIDVPIAGLSLSRVRVHKEKRATTPPAPRELKRREKNEAKLRRQRPKAPLHGHIRRIRYKPVKLCSPRNAVSATDAMREVAKVVRI